MKDDEFIKDIVNEDEVNGEFDGVINGTIEDSINECYEALFQINTKIDGVDYCLGDLVSLDTNQISSDDLASALVKQKTYILQISQVVDQMCSIIDRKENPLNY